MNELPATVTGNDRVDIGGVTVPTRAAARFGSGEQVVMLVRPEDVEVKSLVEGDVAADDGLVGSVVNLTFAGPNTLVRVRIDRLDALVTAHGPSAKVDGMDPGARVSILVDGRRAICETPEAAPVEPVEV